MSETRNDKTEMWCPFCEKVRTTRCVAGLQPGVRGLREVFAGLEVEEGIDDPLVFARTRRCECSAEWGAVEVPTYFLFQLLEERRLYRQARDVAEEVLEHARVVEQDARTLGIRQNMNTKSLSLSIHAAEALLKGLSARSDEYFLR